MGALQFRVCGRMGAGSRASAPSSSAWCGWRWGAAPVGGVGAARVLLGGCGRVLQRLLVVAWNQFITQSGRRPHIDTAGARTGAREHKVNWRPLLRGLTQAVTSPHDHVPTQSQHRVEPARKSKQAAVPEMPETMKSEAFSASSAKPMPRGEAIDSCSPHARTTASALGRGALATLLSLQLENSNNSY